MKALNTARKLIQPLLSIRSWRLFGDYVGVGSKKKSQRIGTVGEIEQFINSRASFVAQTSLYGYMRTRAGTRFPDLFENADIVVSINIAKWHIWLACVSDLSIFIGKLLHQSGEFSNQQIAELVNPAFEQVMQQADIGEEAGEAFALAHEKAAQRLLDCDWAQVMDDDSVFSQSPTALYYWAPIADDLKKRDEAIVRNSIRFRWIEVRRSARQLIDIDALSQRETVNAETPLA